MPSISEMFYTIQGEGPYTGSPAIFVRMNHCHMRCSWCDSKFSVYPEIYKKDPNYKELTNADIPNLVQEIYSQYDKETFLGSASPMVVLTGGEPLHMDNIEFTAELCQQLNLNGTDVYIETTLSTETIDFKNVNVTNVLNTFDLLYATEQFLVDWGKADSYVGSVGFSCSPKLELKCYDTKEIEYKEIMDYYFHENFCTYDSIGGYEVYYKFVYSDIVHTMLTDPHYHDKIKDNVYHIYVMPKTPLNFNADEYHHQCELTAEFCKTYGFTYSPRVHVDIWGLKRGV